MTSTRKLIQKSSKLLKHAPNGLMAHLYEHIINRRIERGLFARGYLEVLDYDMWGYTRSRTCSIDTRLLSQEVTDAFIKTFDRVDEPISAQECYSAAEECACEYSRNYEVTGENVLVKELNALTKLPWVSADAYGIDIEDSSTSVHKVFAASGISYSHRRPTSFTDIDIEYTITGTFFAKNPRLKPIGMMIIQAISSNQINLIMGSNYSCYDTEYIWQEGVQRLAYAHRFRFKKASKPELDKFAKIFENNLALIKSRNFTEKLRILLAERYSKGKEQYFSDITMYDIAAVEIGSRGWAEIATEENIKLVLKNISVRITDTKNDRMISNVYRFMAQD